MKTALTRLLGLEYPIIQGAMAWVSESALAAAMAEAGAAGVIGAGGRSAAWVLQEIKKTKEQTSRPFGLNIMLQADNKDEIFQVAVEEKVDFVTLGAGNPVPYIAKLKEAGIKVIPVVPNLKLAKRVEDSGADAIIIEGMEAGGHIGTLTTMSLMTQVIPYISIPVIVAGGFADGRGLAAALLMGAAGIQMGTRFLVAEECQVHPRVKQRLLEAVDTDSTVTGYGGSHAVRGLKNAFTDKFQALEKAGASQEEKDRLATGTNRLAAVEGDIENGMILAGQSLVPLRQIEPAQKIIEDICTQAVELLKAAPGLLQ